MSIITINNITSYTEAVSYLPYLKYDEFNILINNDKLSKEDIFNLYIDIMNNKSALCTYNTHVLYEYLINLSDDQIEQISKLQINNYYFFMYLPKIELIKKYWKLDSNIFHGITNNNRISVVERKELIKNILINK